MSADYGYIRLHRCIRDNGIVWEERASRLQAWLDLLMLANFEDKTWVNGYQNVDIKRGCFVSSFPRLGQRWGWDKRTVKRFLELLQNENMVKLKVNNHGITVNIVNYCKYQGFYEKDVPQDVPQNVLPLVPQDVLRDVPYEESKRKNNKVKESKRNNKPPLSPLGEMVEKTDYTKTLKDKLHDWLKYKTEKKQSYKPTGFKALLKKIDDVVKSSGEQAVIDAINASMSNNWQGLFFDKFIIDTTSVPKQQTFNMDEFLKRYDE